MNASLLLALKRAPISSIGVPVTMIDPFLAQVDSNTFFVLSKFDQDFSALDEFEAVKVAWAVSPGAIRRVLQLEIEADEGLTNLPPIEFTLGEAATYESLLALSKTKGPRGAIETATYRIATDGQFVCKNIEASGLSFHFRKPDHDGDETPFVIQHKLFTA